jgi:hypothetical protein
MSNTEGMYSIYFIKRIERSETTLRYSAVLRFDNSESHMRFRVSGAEIKSTEA